MNNIRIYDFLSFLLPGLVVLTALCFLFSYIFPILPQGTTFKEFSSVGGSILFFAIAFITGHVVQVFGNEFETKQTKYWGSQPLKTAKHYENGLNKFDKYNAVSIIATLIPAFRFFSRNIRVKIGLIVTDDGRWYSRTLLSPENKNYDIDTKRQIREAAENVLGIKFEENDCIIKTEASEKKEADRKNQEIFDRTYRFILQKNLAPQTENFNAQYGFYRGHCVAFLFLTWVSFACLVIYFVKAAWSLMKIGIGKELWLNLEYFIYALSAFLFFDFLYFLFRRRFERFAFYFANSVYKNFLVWWLSKNSEEKT